jgi:hypothetical protein
MAMGPFPPRIVTPLTTDRVFRTRAGSTILEDMLGVQASVGADSTWRCIWDMPATSLPSGTLKLLLRLRTSATTGNCKVNPKWNCVATGGGYDGVTLNAEGTNTITPAGTAWDLKDTAIALTASTAAADSVLIMSLVFETASWTTAQITGWAPMIEWV